MFEARSRVGEYEILRYVASGGMSEVYEARRGNDSSSVALKVLHRDLCVHAGVVTRFLNEARALEALSHERVVALFAQGLIPGGSPFMALEWLPSSLEQALERAGGSLTAPIAARVVAQIAEGMASLHERGVIHRDLKPGNILMTGSDPARAGIKLADFGLIKVMGAGSAGGRTGALSPVEIFAISTAGSDVLGTAAYTAPEQWIHSKSVDAAADVYSLGVLLFQMLAGSLPFLASRPKEWMAQHTLLPPPLERLDGRAPASLRKLVARMLSKKASLRPTMREVMRSLAMDPSSE
jgi:eukaryotic-like serine/threonine-protein kinase